MSDATKRKCGCDWSLWETCDECNPDDEAAEIRRLRTRLAESEGEVAKAWACRDDEVVLRTMEADKRAAAEAERDDLLGALRDIAESCPFTDAGDRARAAIAKVGKIATESTIKQQPAIKCLGCGSRLPFKEDRVVGACAKCHVPYKGSVDPVPSPADTKENT